MSAKVWKPICGIVLHAVTLEAKPPPRKKHVCFTGSGEVRDAAADEDDERELV